jgi:hypothetical protein
MGEDRSGEEKTGEEDWRSGEILDLSNNSFRECPRVHQEDEERHVIV